MSGPSDHPTHLAPTVAADAAAEAVPAPRPGWRSTVLPRAAHAGPQPELVHEEQPRYETERTLGEGAMGEVVCARDNDIARRIAIKRLRGEVRSSPAALLRFVDEIRTVGRLEHPNIVPIHDVGVDERGDYFFVMKYVDGETLEDIIDKLAAGDAATHARYGFEARTRIFLGILEAIAYAHERGVIHRDLKPANIMVGKFGEVVVMDWGIARRVGSEDSAAGDAAIPAHRLHATRVGSLIGTPAYMAPEQARGEPATERSDIYSLCVVLHELLCLEHYLADIESVDALLEAVGTRPAPLATLVKSPHQPPVPADLAWYVRRGLAKDPLQRYASVREMIDRLERRSEGLVPVQCHLTFTKRVAAGALRLVDRHPMLYTVFLAAGVVASLWGFTMGVLASF
jgi:eukaryotic-like serine/threonine-protein kinase